MPAWGPPFLVGNRPCPLHRLGVFPQLRAPRSDSPPGHRRANPRAAPCQLPHVPRGQLSLGSVPLWEERGPRLSRTSLPRVLPSQALPRNTWRNREGGRVSDLAQLDPSATWPPPSHSELSGAAEIPSPTPPQQKAVRGPPCSGEDRAVTAVPLDVPSSPGPCSRAKGSLRSC